MKKCLHALDPGRAALRRHKLLARQRAKRGARKARQPNSSRSYAGSMRIQAILADAMIAGMDARLPRADKWP